MEDINNTSTITPGLNPYFIGLSTLINKGRKLTDRTRVSQSLFYWIIYSYDDLEFVNQEVINLVSILILLDYLLLFYLFSSIVIS